MVFVPAEECLADPVAAAAGAVEVRVGGRGDPVQEAARVAVVAGMVASVAIAAVPVSLVQHPCLEERTQDNEHGFKPHCKVARALLPTKKLHRLSSAWR